MVEHTPLNYSEITDYIYIGTNACCRQHFDENLKVLGINANISLEEERLDSPWGVDYFLWLPVKDLTPPSLEQLKLGAETLKFFEQEKIKVYVHCRLGHGRSPTLVAAYFIFQGRSTQEAIEAVREKRPEIHLEQSQVEALLQLEKKYGY